MQLSRDQFLSPNFKFGEMIPDSLDPAKVPESVTENLQRLCANLLEYVRDSQGPVIIHDAYRPPALNIAVGGAKESDHMLGCAADFHIADTPRESWQDRTLAAFDWIRVHLAGRFGQLIIEDHRDHFGSPGKLWIHLALPTDKHPGGYPDANTVLVSSAPGQYKSFVDDPKA